MGDSSPAHADSGALTVPFRSILPGRRGTLTQPHRSPPARPPPDGHGGPVGPSRLTGSDWS